MKYVTFILFICAPLFGATTTINFNGKGVFESIAETETNAQKIAVSAKKVLNRFTTNEETEKWWKSFGQELVQAEKDNEVMNMTIFMNRKITNFFLKRKDYLSKMAENECICDIKKEDLIEMCRLFLLCAQLDIPMPKQLEDELTEDKTKTIIRLLDTKLEFKNKK